MNYMGIDYGAKRVGVSICHGDVGIVLPMCAIVSDCDGEKIEKICEMVEKNCVNEIAVGYPLNMDGSVGKNASEVDNFIEKLARALPDDVKISRADERLTSDQATRDRRAIENGQSPAKKRKQRRSGAIDSAAAAIILNDFLNENVKA
ncbi:MAG: Holliday junction resolvase RuvX [Puniceicoccales bacterium]|jgi:putative Holliday junction resolvase|nr:Holliday junction resolvase RuvX [Puniceicoccales bacterium]